MRACDLVIGESYRHTSTPNYAWAKVIKVLKPKENGNPHSRIIVKCEWTVNKNDQFGLTKHFRPSQLIKTKEAK